MKFISDEHEKNEETDSPDIKLRVPQAISQYEQQDAIAEESGEQTTPESATVPATTQKKSTQEKGQGGVQDYSPGPSASENVAQFQAFNSNSDPFSHKPEMHQR